MIKKVIKTETTLYALGKLRTKENKTPLTSTNKNNNNNKCKQLVNSRTTESAISSGSGGDSNDSGGGGYSLYKLAIDETLKNKTQLEHQLVLSDLNLNTNKMAIAIDSEVKLCFYSNFFISILIIFRHHYFIKKYESLKRTRKKMSEKALRPKNSLYFPINIEILFSIYFNCHFNV